MCNNVMYYVHKMTQGVYNSVMFYVRKNDTGCVQQCDVSCPQKCDVLCFMSAK